MVRSLALLLWAGLAVSACDDAASPDDDSDAGDRRADQGPRLLPIDSTLVDATSDADRVDAGARDLGIADGDPPPDFGPEPDATAPEDCPPELPAHLGVHVEDLDGPPLDVADRVRITIDIVGAGREDPAWIRVEHGNLRVDLGGLRLNDAPVDGATVDGRRLTIPLASSAPGRVVYEAEVVAQAELMVVLARLGRTAGGCSNPASGSGALLQLIGGAGKTPVCVPLGEFSSLQVAPRIPLSDTRQYRERNGVREDLVAESFIFCPQSPTIVHSVEFCVAVEEGASVALAGHHGAASDWAVDDFLLVEALRGGAVVADGSTSQRHPGGPNFYCPELDELLCSDGCTARLTMVEGGRSIEPLAVADAVGEAPRRHQDGAVEIGELLPRGVPFDLRLTALDMGVEGEVAPALYLVLSNR